MAARPSVSALDPSQILKLNGNLDGHPTPPPSSSAVTSTTRHKKKIHGAGTLEKYHDHTPAALKSPPHVNNTTRSLQEEKCQDKVDAFANCFTGYYADAYLCSECLVENYPADLTCDGIELALCSAIKSNYCTWYCGRCGSLMVDWQDCVNVGVCNPITCYKFAGDEGPDLPDEQEECQDKNFQFVHCFAYPADAWNCEGCFETGRPNDEDLTCLNLQEADCSSAYTNCTFWCGTCGTRMLKWNDCINEGLCDPITCNGAEVEDEGECQFEIGAFAACMNNVGLLTEEKLAKCLDCLKAERPENPSCDEVVQICDLECGGCGSLVLEWDDCSPNDNLPCNVG